MIEALIVYDTTGYIVSQSFGSVREPIGIPFLKVDIPSGKYAASVDLSEDTPKVILKDVGISGAESEIELLKEKQALMEKAIEDLILAGGAL